jgi:hypothetical protein
MPGPPKVDYRCFMTRPTRRAPLVAALIAAAAILGAALLAPAIEASDPGAVAAKKKRGTKRKITGKLNKRGYTVIALSDTSTRASTVQAKGKSFKLSLPGGPIGKKTKGVAGKIVTLHLRAPDGTYAGPIVLGTPGKRKKAGKKGKRRVIVGVNAKNGASLGAIKIKPSKGYARTKRKPAAKFVYSKRVAQASKKGIPIGNGRNVGLVRSTAHGPSQDPDLDGVPNTLDVDDNGNLILDKLDASTAASTSLAAHQSLATPHPNPVFGLGTQVVGQTTNAYTSSDQQIAAAFPSELWLGIQSGGVDPGSAELDCGALTYCSAGGTGRYKATPSTPFATAQAFPGPPGGPLDPDGDGFGSLLDTGPSPGASDFHGTQLFPGTTPDRIHPGDVLIERATRDGVPVETAVSQGLIISTFPALAQFNDGQGDSGDLSYPRDELTPVPVRANPSGDVVVKLTFWRPQRLPTASETAPDGWVDMGHLNHLATPQEAGPSSTSTPGLVPSACPASSYSEIGPNLTPLPAEAGKINAYHLKDREEVLDQATPTPSELAANPNKRFANTFSYTLNLTDCLASYGISMAIGSTHAFNFFAVLPPSPPTTGNANSVIRFQRVG